MPTSTTVPDDDELDELPPLDGETEREEDPDYSDLVDDAPADASDDALDDRTGEDDPVGDEELDTAGSETGWLDDAQESENLDIGTTELVTFDEGSPLDDLEEQGGHDEDYGFDDDSKLELDGGEEGPLVLEDEVSEDDLPRLDADEEGDVEDVDIADPSFEPDAGMPWAARLWTPVLAPVDVGRVTAIACAARGVVAAAGGRLVRIDLEGAAEPLAARGLAGDVRSVAASPAALVALATDGALYVSTDAGASFARVASGVRDAALSLGVLWILTSARALKRSRDLGATWEDAPRHAVVDAICATHAGGVATFESGAIVREPEAPVPVPDAPAVWSEPPILAARGAFAACIGARKIRLYDGAAWRTIDAPGVVAATFADDRGTLVAATYRDADDASWLTCIDAQGHTVVAELNATRDDDDADGRIRALARDDARGVLWVAGGFGVTAFELS